MPTTSLDREALRAIAARPPVFVVGCPRSGTTLLQVMLDTHRELTVGHECDFVTDVSFDPRATRWSLSDSLEQTYASVLFDRLGVDEASCREIVAEMEPADYPEAIRLLFAARAVKNGKARWGNKTPHMIFHLGRLAQIFPDAQFVHIVRDGRDSAASWSKVGFSDSNRRQILSSALLWRHMVNAGRAQGRKLASSRYLEIHLEDLIASTTEVLELVCRYLSVDFDEGMLQYHETATERVPKSQHRLHPAISRPPETGLRNWTEGVSSGDIVAIEAMLRSTLVEFGYRPGERTSGRVYEAAQLGRGYAIGGAAEIWSYRRGLWRELERRVRAVSSN
ncbi:MAG: sulfotransferase family protein [Acidimicrobiales bacterium]